MNDLKLLEKNLCGSNTHLFSKMMYVLERVIFPSFFRVIEIVTAAVISVLLGFPIFIYLAVRKLSTGKKIFSREVIVGRGGEPLMVKHFNITLKPFSSLALLYSVVKGDLTFVGGSFVKYELKKLEPENNYLRDLKPGIFSLWELRSSSKIGHEGRMQTEWEYCFTKNYSRDAFIALRSIPAYLMRGAEQQAPSTVTIFDVAFQNITMNEAVSHIEDELVSKSGTRSIFYVNADCLNRTFKDDGYHSLLENADYVLPDGIGINIACRILGTAMKENVNGTDMLPFLCAMAKRKGHKIFLLGGRPGVADKMAEKISESYEVKVAGVQHGYFDHPSESKKVVDHINRSGAGILLVAFGAPLQEKWIAAHQSQLKVGAALGVGGLFDFYSGNTLRAPRWLRELGLEWIYRIIQEPGRMWRRYVIGNPLFLYRVMVWRAQRKSNAGE